MRRMGYDELKQARPKPIMLRAAITAAEWTRIRKRAIDAGMTTAEYVATLLRKGLAQHEH